MYVVRVVVKSIFHCIHFNMMKKEEEQIPCNIYHINFKYPKAVLIAKVSPCVSSAEKAETVCMQIITTMALAKLYGTPDKYHM